MNKKGFVAIIIMIIFHTCGIPNGDYTETNYHYLINKSRKNIVHELVCNRKYVEQDTFRFYSEGTTIDSELEWIVSGRINRRQTPFVMYDYTHIYNINDTTSVHLGCLASDFEYQHDFYDFYKIVENTYSLTISDSLLSLMHKDYTMSEKFPEYYK